MSAGLLDHFYSVVCHSVIDVAVLIRICALLVVLYPRSLAMMAVTHPPRLSAVMLPAEAIIRAWTGLVSSFLAPMRLPDKFTTSKPLTSSALPSKDRKNSPISPAPMFCKDR